MEICSFTALHTRGEECRERDGIDPGDAQMISSPSLLFDPDCRNTAQCACLHSRPKSSLSIHIEMGPNKHQHGAPCAYQGRDSRRSGSTHTHTAERHRSNEAARGVGSVLLAPGRRRRGTALTCLMASSATQAPVMSSATLISYRALVFCDED